MDGNELTKLIEQSKISWDYTLQIKIGGILKNYSINDTWVYTVCANGTNEPLIHEVNGKQFIPVFSNEDLVRAKGNSVLAISINKIIGYLLQNPKIGGIEINPFVHNFCIETGELLGMVFGDMEYFQSEIKDWGKGIPNYSETDLMDEKSLLDFAIQTLGNYCQKNGIINVFCTNNMDACPNVLIEKDGKITFVLVEASVAPDMPELSFEKRKLLLTRAKHFGYDCYYAPIGFGSSDPERFDRSLALKGDRYFGNFKGLQKVEEIYN